MAPSHSQAFNGESGWASSLLRRLSGTGWLRPVGSSLRSHNCFAELGRGERTLRGHMKAKYNDTNLLKKKLDCKKKCRRINAPEKKHIRILNTGEEYSRTNESPPPLGLGIPGCKPPRRWRPSGRGPSGGRTASGAQRPRRPASPRAPRTHLSGGRPASGKAGGRIRPGLKKPSPPPKPSSGNREDRS